MASDRNAADPLADPNEPRGLVQRFWREVKLEQQTAHCGPSEAIARAAKREPALYLAVRDSESILLTGTRGQFAAHLRGDPRGGRTADEFRLKHPIDLDAAAVEDGVFSLSRGPLEGTGPRRGPESIQDDIDPRRTSNARELDSQDALRAAAKQRGYVPIDERFVQNFVDSDQITQDAEEGDPDAEWVMRARSWLYQKQLKPTVANIAAAFKATANE
jgi:hypothetical protein